ncbi:hypothetical protein DNC80_14270 [Flavobacterium sp. SOK18b]|uniref:hypothetical protein n=1 Tax=Flavobacterium sp. SOK18b TaxID=797900 RepID=UPI0015F9D76C|nr:hypothetical protein [Flavobacterium sp. SOK18b]MBB1194832.1 hypothetical protein [Flavobacterium sp. SOK18b]
MQNSEIKVLNFRRTKFKNFISKLRAAYRFVKAKESFVVIEKDISCFNMTAYEVAIRCDEITTDIVNMQVEKENQRIDQSIQRLVNFN